MTSNDEDDRGLEEFIEYAEEGMGYTLTDWQRDMLAAMYDRHGPLEVHAYVDKADREYDKVDDELSDLVDEFLSSPAKGRPVALDLGDLTDKVREAIEEAGYPVNHTATYNMDTHIRDMARQLSEAVDADVVKSLDDDALGRLVDLVNEEWSSRGHLTPTDEENLHASPYGEPPEATAETRAYAAEYGSYLGALMDSGFKRNEAMSMVMVELQANLARRLKDD